jgi:hypothetical protein
MEIKARLLKTTDIFAFIRIIKKAGVRKEVAALGTFVHEAQKENKKVDVSEVGMEFMLLLLESTADAENEIIKFLASVCQVSADEMSDLELPQLFEAVKSIIEVNDLKVFLRVLPS